MPATRLKLAFVVDRFGNRFGGAEAYGVALMRELSAICDITVFAREYDPACDVRLPNVLIRSWRAWPSWCRVLLFAFKAAHQTTGKFDVVHSHVNGWSGNIDVLHVTPVRYKWRITRASAWQALMTRISPRISTYLWMESCRVRSRTGHRTVAVSGLIAQQLEQAYGPIADIQIIPPGVSAAPLPDASARAAQRHALGFSPDDRVCLLVARNPLRKGLPVILKAMGQLPGHVKLLVVGGDDTTRAYVRQHVAAEVMERVVVAGETSNVDAYYAVADLYVHPTLNDSYGMAPLEAMAFGLPVIVSATPWCGLSQYIRHEQEALLLSQPEDPDELAGSITRILEDDSLRRRLAQGGKDFSLTRGWPEIARQYLDLYHQSMAERRTPETSAEGGTNQGGNR